MIAAPRRTLLAAALALPALGTRAQAPRIETLRLYVPAAAGGGWDGVARVMDTVLRETGAIAAAQIENLPGAGGEIGLPRFMGMRGRRDTLMVAGLALVSAAIRNRSPLSPLRDTNPIARLQGEAHVLAVPANSSLASLGDFIAALRADPLGVTVAIGSVGGTDHITLGLIGRALGLTPDQLSPVAFNSGGPAANAVMIGQVRAGIATWTEWEPHVESGRMRVLGVTSEARVPGLAAPTFREAGLDVVFTNWRGVFAPPGIPAEHVAALDALIGAMVASAAWKREAERRHWQQIYLPRRDFVPFLEAETRAVDGVLKSLGV